MGLCVSCFYPSPARRITRKLHASIGHGKDIHIVSPLQCQEKSLPSMRKRSLSRPKAPNPSTRELHHAHGRRVNSFTPNDLILSIFNVALTKLPSQKTAGQATRPTPDSVTHYTARTCSIKKNNPSVTVLMKTTVLIRSPAQRQISSRWPAASRPVNFDSA
jgi:hypothetical protein